MDQVTAWFWGHEHNQVIYGAFQHNTFKSLQRGRLIGHGAFPVALDEVPDTPKFPQVPIRQDAKKLDLRPDQAFFNHGYAIMRLNGAAAEVAYYQDSDETNPLFMEGMP